MYPTKDHAASPAYQHPLNHVLQPDARVSTNFFESDLILTHFLQKYVSKQGFTYMESRWRQLGEKAACLMDRLSLLADKQSPQLIKRDHFGETINEIRFHPAYHELMKIAVESEMFAVKWKPELRARFQNERHRLGFAANFLFAMGEGGIPCPLCMTDGVALLLDRFGKEFDKARLLPHIYTDRVKEFFTGAMFLTEKSGGSDVGANLVRATRIEEDYYVLNGEKWFCSNANAEIIFALARTNPEIKGTRGLSLFLIEPFKPDGSKNEMDIVRLKDKLGVRSMASAECVMTDTWGKRVGEEGEGFKIMAEMVNLSRLYNATAAVSFMRRALVEAYQFLSFRKSFGKVVLEHALIREKLSELATIYISDFYLTWQAIMAMDEAESGNAEQQELIRLLTPMVKKVTAQNCVYLIRECMELMGGMGYIEDGIMPKLMRDAMVLPIWEGAGNIMTLDMLRATAKSQGLQIMTRDISQVLGKEDTLIREQLTSTIRLAEMLPSLDQDTRETTANRVYGQLAKLYAYALLRKFQDKESKAWIDPAMQILKTSMEPTQMTVRRPFSRTEVEAMLGWSF